VAIGVFRRRQEGRFWLPALVAGVGFEPTTFRLWAWLCKKHLLFISKA